MFYEMSLAELPQGAKYFFNIVIALIAIPVDSDYILPLNIQRYWYLGALTDPRPHAILFFRDASITDPSVEFEYEIIPHCVIAITQQQDVNWYEMVDYDTEDPWDPTPILEDFSYEDDEDI